MAETGDEGFWLAWIILIAMIIGLGYTGIQVWRGFRGAALPRINARFRYAVPLLALIGLGVAAYLAYVESASVEAFCGPIGNCNTVQSSPYARVFGIPIGTVGLAGYGLILLAWLWGQRGDLPLADQMPLIVFCAALFSVLFSIYLTYLEIFVIRAVCIWCLTSAVVVTLILLASAGPMLAEQEIQ
jgi:uncharacterized membrane protein